MIRLSKSTRLSGLTIGFVLLAGTAFAGPQMTFGPENEGALQIDYKGQFQMATRDNSSGTDNNDTSASFNFRRNRLSLMGKYTDTFGLYVQTEFNENQNTAKTAVGQSDAGSTSSFEILDAAMRFNLHDSFKVSVGKFKYNFQRENLEACENPLTLDRSLFIRSPFVTTRDKGVAVWGNLFDDKFQYRVDAMNGRPQATGAVSPEANFRYSLRGHVTLLDPEKDYGYKGTYLGKKKVLTIGAAYQFENKVAYGDTVTKTDAKDYKAWTADLFFEYPIEKMGTVTFATAYEDVDLGDAYKGANPDADTFGINGQKNGYYVKAGYLLPNLPLQFFGRYEQWAFASLNNIYDQKIDWFGGGINYYFKDQNLKLTMELSHTKFDKEAEVAGVRSWDFNTFITQLQVIF